MTTQSCHPDSHVRHELPSRTPRNPRPPAGKLKPASQSYLHGPGEAAVIGFIFGVAVALLAAKVWLIRLLG